MQDLWLLKLDSTDPGAIEAPGQTPPQLRMCRAMDASLAYLYLPGELAPGDALSGVRADRLRLACIREIAGASPGETARYHYVVETDVLAAHEEDFNAWYDEEHLPGLAAVPGVVRAARYLDASGSPRYYACYDLASLDAFGSPAWLAVRGTAWSSRVRPSFRNTRRTMFEL